MKVTLLEDGAGAESPEGGILNPLGTADRATAATMIISFLKSYEE